MNVAVVGRGQINSILMEKLEENGLIPFLLDNIDEITGFKGEKLNYEIHTRSTSINAGYAIVTEELFNEGFSNSDGVIVNGSPVVFLLDYPAESPAYFTVDALEKGIYYARRKKQVFYLSRFMRTAGARTESLYREARNAGVTFIKYSDMSICRDKDTGVYRITAGDGYEDISIETPSVISADSTAYTGEIDRIARVLRLKTDGKGLLNEDKSFLYSSLTSRSGIYYLNQASLTSKEELLERIGFIVAEIKNEIGRNFHNKSLIDIDAGKCAFCYTCFRACPHSAMAPDYENSVMKNLKNNCQACGICVSVCPADAVRLSGRGPVSTEAGSKALKVLCCENSGEIAARKIKNEFSELFDHIELVPVSCGGEMSVETITTALTNYEKVLVVTCMDDACKHFEGNKRAERFVKKAREMLKASGMDENRVECLKISHAMPYMLRDQIKEMI